MRTTHVFAGIPVTDYGAAIEWYEQLLRRPPSEPGPGGMPTAVLSDPDGNQVKLFEDPSA